MARQQRQCRLQRVRVRSSADAQSEVPRHSALAPVARRWAVSRLLRSEPAMTAAIAQIQENQWSMNSSTILHITSARWENGTVMWFSQRVRMRDAWAGAGGACERQQQRRTEHERGRCERVSAEEGMGVVHATHACYARLPLRCERA